MFNRLLSSFVPTVYKDVVEMDDIINAEQIHMDTAKREMFTAFANTFVLTADELGIKMFESMLGIVANPHTEDLEFRRERIINRLSMSPPFTFRFLKQKLDEIIGVGAWTAYIDFDNYTLYVESSATDQNWYTEMAVTINKIKPCNMVFTNVPYMASVLSINEEISYSSLAWKYRLGGWRLGEHPFAIVNEGGVIKMANSPSIEQKLLDATAGFVAEDISYALINDTVRISEFSLKKVTDSSVSIEYPVTPGMTTLITNVKLMREDGTVLTQASVYVPVTETVVNKHVITVKEGA